MRFELPLSKLVTSGLVSRMDVPVGFSAGTKNTASPEIEQAESRIASIVTNYRDPAFFVVWGGIALGLTGVALHLRKPRGNGGY